MLQLHPWMPSRIHAAQIVRIVGCLYQRTHFIRFDIIEVGNVVQSLHNGVNGFIDQRYDFLHIHFRFLCNFTVCVQNGLLVFESFLVNGKYFVAQDGSQYGRQLNVGKEHNLEIGLVASVQPESAVGLTLKLG